MNSQPLEIRSSEVGPWPMNSYALVCPHTNQSVLIDPGADPDTLQAMLAGTTPVAIWITHSHPDHIGALDEMRARLGVPVWGHADLPVQVDKTLSDGDRLTVGDHGVQVYATPGHTADMLTFLAPDASSAIVGDTLFEGGPGRTWSSAGFATTGDTLRNVVLQFPDDTVCYAGHGPSFRLGDIRPAIEEFLRRDHGDFHGDATWDM